MPSLTETTRHHDFGPRFWAKLRAQFIRIDAAHTRQAQLADLSQEASHDTGLSLEDLVGARAYEPALPFFLQSGFGKR